MLLLICRSAPALCAAIWVYSLIKAAAILASSALFMVMLMHFPSGLTVVILLD
jgi:hypothetical protein